MARKKKVKVEEAVEGTVEAVKIVEEVVEETFSSVAEEEEDLLVPVEEHPLPRVEVSGYKRVRLYAKPHNTADTVRMVSEGDILVVFYDVDYRWLRVMTDDGKQEGYIQKRFVKDLR